MQAKAVLGEHAAHIFVVQMRQKLASDVWKITAGYLEIHKWGSDQAKYSMFTKMTADLHLL